MYRIPPMGSAREFNVDFNNKLIEFSSHVLKQFGIHQTGSFKCTIKLIYSYMLQQ